MHIERNPRCRASLPKKRHSFKLMYLHFQQDEVKELGVNTIFRHVLK